MRIDPVECRENAMKCRKLATETTARDRPLGQTCRLGCYVVPLSRLGLPPFCIDRRSRGGRDVNRSMIASCRRRL